MARCSQDKSMHDCFAYCKGECTVLSNTQFIKKKCPFYKDKVTNEIERIKYPYNPMYECSKSLKNEV